MNWETSYKNSKEIVMFLYHILYRLKDESWREALLDIIRDNYQSKTNEEKIIDLKKSIKNIFLIRSEDIRDLSTKLEIRNLMLEKVWELKCLLINK